VSPPAAARMNEPRQLLVPSPANSREHASRSDVPSRAPRAACGRPLVLMPISAAISECEKSNTSWSRSKTARSVLGSWDSWRWHHDEKAIEPAQATRCA